MQAATQDVIGIITADYSKEDLIRATPHIDDIFVAYEHKVFNAIMTCMEQSITYLKNRIAGEPSCGCKQPVFQAEVIFRFPTVELTPSLEEIQRCVNRLTLGPQPLLLGQ